MKDKIIKKIRTYTLYLEITLVIIIGIAVVMGIPDLFRYMVVVLTSAKELSYDAFSNFLKHVLMLVVGLEMAMMILTHSHQSILTLTLFVIARKMLVYAESMFDLFIGTLSIAVIFIIFKFFTGSDDLLAKYDNTFSAAVPVEKIRREFGFKLPETEAKTLGGLIYELSIDRDIKLEEDSIILFGDYKLTIISYTDGIIKRVLIEER